MIMLNKQNAEGINAAAPTALAEALTVAMMKSVESLGFDVRCLDWFSTTPDFHIEQKNKKAA